MSITLGELQKMAQPYLVRMTEVKTLAPYLLTAALIVAVAYLQFGVPGLLAGSALLVGTYFAYHRFPTFNKILSFVPLPIQIIALPILSASAGTSGVLAGTAILLLSTSLQSWDLYQAHVGLSKETAELKTANQTLSEEKKQLASSAQELHSQIEQLRTLIQKSQSTTTGLTELFPQLQSQWEQSREKLGTFAGEVEAHNALVSQITTLVQELLSNETAAQWVHSMEKINADLANLRAKVVEAHCELAARILRETESTGLTQRNLELSNAILEELINQRRFI